MTKLSKWQSGVFDGLSQMAKTGPDGQPRAGSLMPSSLSVRILWWFHVIAPFLVFLTAAASSRADSADEALGSVFIYGDLFLLATGLGLFVGIATVKSRRMTVREKSICTLLALGVVPLVLLMWAADSAMGWPRTEFSGAAVTGVALLHICWIAMVLAAQRAFRQARSGERHAPGEPRVE